MGEGTNAFAGAFREATERTGWTLSALADALTELGTPVTAATLSYWRTGRRRPGRQASADVVRNIEQLLELESGSLLAHVVGPRARGRGARYRPLDRTGNVQAERLALMFRAMGMPRRQGHTALTVNDHLQLDERGVRVAQRTIQVLRATQEGTAHLYLGLVDDLAVDGPAEVDSLTIGEIGLHYVDRDLRIQAFRIDLPGGLAEGETVLLEMMFRFRHAEGRLHHQERWITYAMHEHALAVQFHPDLLPEEVECYNNSSTVAAGQGIGAGSGRAVALRRGLAQRVELDLAPGTTGMRWRFPGETWAQIQAPATADRHPAVSAAWRDWSPPGVTTFDAG